MRRTRCEDSQGSLAKQGLVCAERGGVGAGVRDLMTTGLQPADVSPLCLAPNLVATGDACRTSVAEQRLGDGLRVCGAGLTRGVVSLMHFPGYYTGLFCNAGRRDIQAALCADQN